MLDNPVKIQGSSVRLKAHQNNESLIAFDPRDIKLLEYSAGITQIHMNCGMIIYSNRALWEVNLAIKNKLKEYEKEAEEKEAASRERYEQMRKLKLDAIDSLNRNDTNDRQGS